MAAARAVERVRTRLLAAAVRTPRIHRLLWGIARRQAGRYRVASIAVVIDDGDGALGNPRVLVAQHAFRGGAWALPGGWVRAREDPYRALERELREELGVEFAALDVVGCERQGTADDPLPYDALTLAIRCRAHRPFDVGAVVLSVELSAVRWLDTTDLGGLLSPFEIAAVDAALVRFRSGRT